MVIINGEEETILLTNRVSCEDLILWIVNPVHKNKVDLNIACTSRWKNANCGCFREIDNIIKPSCLRVDKATIFFISISNIAAKAGINVVAEAVINKIFVKSGWLSIITENRIIK